MSKRLFLSCASREFSHVRDPLTKDCHFPDLDVKSHEEIANFNTGGTTLEKLDTYISGCNAIVHLIGHAVGTQAEAAGIQAVLRRHSDLEIRLPQVAPLIAPGAPWRGSYTQWEAYLALYHRIPCHVFIATDGFERPKDFALTSDETQQRSDHLQRLEVREQDRLRFESREDLRIQVQRSLRHIIPADAVTFRADITRIVKYAPLELIGRDDETKLLHDAWLKVRRAEAKRPHVLTFVALGGEGKTSLIAKWAASLADDNWPGCDTAFAWSFYSQGTRDQVAASSDLFLAEALAFFGDKEMAQSKAGGFEKGKRLAQLVGERRALLVLDGLEPLQYAPTAPTPGELKDQGIAALLKGLATNSQGLCVVTTRYSIPELRAFRHTTAPEKELKRLSRDAGVHLLKAHGVTGSDRRNIPLDGSTELLSEFEKLVEDVDGHALTLHIMGSFLKKAFQGDIRKRDRVTFEKASKKTDNDHAFRAMGAYAKWMEDGGDEAKRELAILRLLGLFDRPATDDCITALLKSPAIDVLTEPLVGLPEDDWNCSLDALEEAKLLTVNREASGALTALDSHPLLREYFARELRRAQNNAWRAAHRRLFEYLCASTHEGNRPALEDLQPLFQAVAHGCQAGLQQQACDRVYFARVIQRNQDYTSRKLGAFGSDLGAVACFFEQPWCRVSPALTESDQSWLLGVAAFRLRALGRLSEALEPMRAAIEMAKHSSETARDESKRLHQLNQVSICAGNLSELELTLGEVAAAERYAAQSVVYADRSGDEFQRMAMRTTHADALHQAGRRGEAETRFREAEQMQQKSRPNYPLLDSVQGTQYCDLFLAAPERAAWQEIQKSVTRTQTSECVGACRAVVHRTAKTLDWWTNHFTNASLLTIALHHLTLGRAALYAAILEKSEIESAKSEIEATVDGLRRAGTMHHLPHGLLTRSCLRFLTGARTGPESAQEDLDEAWEIAERGPMPLFMADIHLHRARLFFRETSYPWSKDKDGKPRGPRDDLADAEKLINACGYHRRDEELTDAKKAILGV